MILSRSPEEFVEGRAHDLFVDGRISIVGCTLGHLRDTRCRLIISDFISFLTSRPLL